MKPNKEQKQDRINQAYELRLRGKSYRQIGAEMGISAATAYRYVTEHLENVTLPLVEEVRKTEVDRMMRYLDSLDERIDAGEIPAVTTALKVSERLCKMLGVDVPVKTEVEVTEVSALDVEIRSLVEQQQAMNEQRKREIAAKNLGASESESGSDNG